jgi:hypothetical protein
MFDFKHISAFERAMADEPGAMVLFATPGMLHAGLSLEVFKKWAGSEKNMVILPGYIFSFFLIFIFLCKFFINHNFSMLIFRYCVVGTVGNRLLAGKNRSNVSFLLF